MTEAFAWAVIAPDWGSPPHHVAAWTVRGTRREAMEAFAGHYADLPTRKAWKRAYRNGWRLERVVIRRWGHA